MKRVRVGWCPQLLSSSKGVTKEVKKDDFGDLIIKDFNDKKTTFMHRKDRNQ